VPENLIEVESRMVVTRGWRQRRRDEERLINGTWLQLDRNKTFCFAI
jgi:hypothetical protein